MDIQQPLARKRSHGRKRYLLLSPRIDMTPMVDLGFLLITFFIFTTSMSQPSAMSLYMPSDKPTLDSNKLEDRFALTVILDYKDEIFYYHGAFDDARLRNEIFKTDYDQKNGIGNVIRLKQKSVELYEEGRTKIMVIIKPTHHSSYKNTVDLLDEMLINNVKRYAIVDLAKEELVYLEREARE